MFTHAKAGRTQKIDPGYSLPNTISRTGNNIYEDQLDQAYRDLRQKEAASFANLSGFLRQATYGKANFGIGSASRAEAQMLGEAWVGEGYRESSEEGILISRNGLRQYRPPSLKPNSLDATTGVQANFESRVKPSGQWQSNAHLDINDP